MLWLSLHLLEITISDLQPLMGPLFSTLSTPRKYFLPTRLELCLKTFEVMFVRMFYYLSKVTFTILFVKIGYVCKNLLYIMKFIRKLHLLCTSYRTVQSTMWTIFSEFKDFLRSYFLSL